MTDTQTTEPAQKAKQMASSAVESLKGDAADLAQQAQHKAHDALQQQTQTATQTLEDFAGAIRKAGEELAQHDQSMASRLVRQAADSLEHLSRSVADKRPSELLDAARDFGRRNPIAFAGGAVLLGVALGRFVRSSETHAQTGESDGASWGSNSGSTVGSGLGVGSAVSSSYGGPASGQSLPGGVASSPEAVYDTALTGATGASGGTSGAGALSAQGLSDYATAGGSTPQEGALTGGSGSGLSSGSRP